MSRIPQVGDQVLFVLPDGPCRGEARPAVIVKMWATTFPFTANLQVFTDGSNDGEQYKTGIFWATSVPADEEEKALRTWHYLT